MSIVNAANVSIFPVAVVPRPLDLPFVKRDVQLRGKVVRCAKYMGAPGAYSVTIRWDGVERERHHEVHSCHHPSNTSWKILEGWQRDTSGTPVNSMCALSPSPIPANQAAYRTGLSLPTVNFRDRLVQRREAVIKLSNVLGFRHGPVCTAPPLITFLSPFSDCCSLQCRKREGLLRRVCRYLL